MKIAVYSEILERSIVVEAHPSITEERVVEAVERRMSTLDNPGFCLACGDEAMSCEPDARNYQCEACGERQVFGADELLIGMVP